MPAATVLPYASISRAARSRSASLNGLASQRQPLSSRKRSASVPATSPVHEDHAARQRRLRRRRSRGRTAMPSTRGIFRSQTIRS